MKLTFALSSLFVIQVLSEGNLRNSLDDFDTDSALTTSLDDFDNDAALTVVDNLPANRFDYARRKLSEDGVGLVPIRNPSFEEDDHVDGLHTGGTPGWEKIGEGSAGDWDPTERHYANLAVKEQVAYATSRTGDISGFKQQLNVKFDSSVDYYLSVDIGNRADMHSDNRYEILLTAGETIIGVVNGNVRDIPNGAFTTAGVHVVGYRYRRFEGRKLGIEILNIGSAGKVELGQISFDNVQLETMLPCEGGSIYIRNHDFQERDVHDGGHNRDGAPGWDKIGHGSAGDWDFKPWNYYNLDPQEQVGYANAWKEQSGGLRQVLTTKFDSALNYRLSVDIGNRYDSLDALYEVRLYAGEKIIGLIAGKVLEVQNGRFETVGVDVEGMEFAKYHGQILAVELVSVAAQFPDEVNKHTGQTNFDNVKLISKRPCKGGMIFIRNSGFQETQHADGVYSSGAPGWKQIGISGDWDPQTKHYESLEEDDQVAFAKSTEDIEVSGFEQILSEKFDASLDYVLRVDVGNRDDISTTSRFQLLLFAGDAIIGTAEGKASDVEKGEFETVKMPLVRGVQHRIHGGYPLKIQLLNIGEGHTDFDNVKLRARRPIGVKNSDFSLGNHGEGGYTGGIPDWDAVGAGRIGDWNPPASSFADIALEEQVAWANAGSGQTSGMAQTLPEAYDPALDYKLSVDVMNRKGNYDAKYEVRLIAGETVLGIAVGSVKDIPNAGFITVDVEVDSAAELLTYECQYLKIELLNVGADGNGLGQVNFDNVRLSSTCSGRGRITARSITRPEEEEDLCEEEEEEVFDEYCGTLHSVCEEGETCCEGWVCRDTLMNRKMCLPPAEKDIISTETCKGTNVDCTSGGSCCGGLACQYVPGKKARACLPRCLGNQQTCSNEFQCCYGYQCQDGKCQRKTEGKNCKHPNHRDIIMNGECSRDIMGADNTACSILCCTDGRINQKYSPLALDMDHSGDVERITAVDLLFDITDNGVLEYLHEWFAPYEGILVNTNIPGRVLTGAHLFGDEGGRYKNGFDKLSLFDKNHDGIVSGKELSGIKLWFDKNSNAYLDEGELMELDDFMIVALSLENVKMVGHAELEDGGQIRMEDLWFDGEETSLHFNLEDLDEL